MDLFNNAIGRDLVFNGMTNPLLTQQAIEDLLKYVEMIKQILYLLVIALFLVGCKASKKSNEKKYLSYLLSKDDYLPEEYFKKLRSFNITKDSVLSNTTDFYKIKIVSKPHKKVFNIDELKLFSLKITNYGTKELYLPEYFKTHKLDNHPEMFIKIYKKKGKKFKKYIQKRLKTQTLAQPKLNQNRAIFKTNKGKHISYENNWIDLFYKIVDEGFYHAEIYIDLSNFGYFKILKTDIYFEVTN